MKKFYFKKLVLIGLIAGLVLSIPYWVIMHFFVSRVNDIHQMHDILEISLLLNLVLIVFPHIFKLAAKRPKDEEKKEE